MKETKRKVQVLQKGIKRDPIKKLVRIVDCSEQTGFECYLLETAVGGTFPRGQFAVRWRTGPAGYSALEIRMTVASAEKYKDVKKGP